MEHTFFPVSVWYSGGKARAPMLSPVTEHSSSEWKKDLAQIKSLGFNTVRTWVEWAHCEPVPGEFNFENLTLLMECAGEAGLKVFIQMYADSAPEWVGQRFPEAQFEAQSGEKVPSQAAPGYCTDHDGVREAVLNFYTKTAEVAVKYPHFFGWDLWSEPHIINWAIITYVPNAQFCYCPSTRARFRSWLKNKYETLENLNKAWYRNFREWDKVEPPRFGTILSYTDYIDWKTFIMEKLASDLKMRHDAIRKVDTSHVITSHAAVPSLFTTPLWGDGTPDDFLMADRVDFYGTSLYPKHSFPEHHWPLIYFIAMADFSRSANIRNKGFYIGELQAGFGTRGVVVGDPVTAGDQRTWFWSVVAKGAKGIHFFSYFPMSSGYESGGYGLISLDGTLMERAKAAGDMARTMGSNMSLSLEPEPVKAEVALVYNPLAQMVGGEQHCGPEMALRDSLLGYYRIFMDNNIPVDFIHRRDLEDSDLSPYKVLIVPYPIMFTLKAAEGLKQYIKDGGLAIAEARLAWNNETGFASEIIPGMGLHDVFGVREESVKMEDDVQMHVVEQPHAPVLHLKKGLKLKGAYFVESVSLLKDSEDARVIACLDDQRPVIVANRFGKGETFFVGTFLGLAHFKNACRENEQFVLEVLRHAGVARPFTSSHDGKKDSRVEIRLQESNHGKILFIVNHGEKEEKVRVRMKVDEGTYYIKSLISEEISEQNTEHGILEIDRVIEARSAEILHIRG